MKQRENEQKVQVKRSNAGLGLFAATDFDKEDFVVEYTGEKISSEEADRRGGRYLFTLTDDLILDGKERGNIARYINHSCRPNCEAEVDEEEEKIRIFARKKIKAGEELTSDYGSEYFNDYIKPVGCKCEKCQSKK